MPDPIIQVADNFADRYANLNPLAALDLGLVSRIDSLGDFSPGGYEQRAELERHTLEELSERRPSSKAGRRAGLHLRCRLERPNGWMPSASISGRWGRLGAAVGYPENTLAAFARALDAGADIIELDVHPTADYDLVVLHDLSLSRTTGVDRLLAETKTYQVTDLDAGSWFDQAFANERVPLLSQVLDWARDRAYLNLDIRHYPAMAFYHAGRTIDALLAAIDEVGISQQVTLQSPDHVLMAAIHRQRPDIAVGVTQHGHPLDMAAIAATAGATLVSVDAPTSPPM